jgi:HD domain
MSETLPRSVEDVSTAPAGLSATRVILTPPLCTMGENAHLTQYDVLATLGNGRHLMMGDDPRLPKMPARPRLVDFFRYRFVPMVANHLLQSASLARKAGLDEKVVMGCLLHDIANGRAYHR